MSLSGAPAHLGFGGVLKAALLAGLAAALVVAVFHFVVTEPVIEQAIALEGSAEHAVEPEVVTRDAQRIGLFVGWAMYGLTWALLFACIFQLTRGLFAGATLGQRGVVLAVAMMWGVCLLPFIRYPANPPGVGEAETIAYRQTLYLAMLALSVVGVVATGLLGQYLARRIQGQAVPWGASLAFLAVYSAVLYVAMPLNPDPIRAPTSLVDQFRLLSATGLVMFWAIMGPAFAFLAGRAAQPRPVAVARPT